MPFVKVVKSKAYFKRYQVKYARRRDGKTDYRARRQMVSQDKTKYGAPKYRLVVRRSNKDVTAQIVSATPTGDVVLQAAYSHELPAFGIKFGLTNYAACYATGLLLARRVLTKLKVAEKFPGVKEANGEYKPVRDKKTDESESEDPFPFKAILDVGLVRTTTGARIFGVLKGAVDGGLAVPHKPSRFPGFKKDKGLDAKKHRERIFGIHVANYMKKVAELKKQSPDAKFTQFATLDKAGIKPEQVEKIYKDAHAAIRKNPTLTVPKKPRAADAKHKAFNVKKLSRKAKDEAAKKKVATLRARLGK
jgi:large subunit ribosomal protein L5e